MPDLLAYSTSPSDLFRASRLRETVGRADLRRRALWMAIAVVGILLLDRSVGALGDYLRDSPYWEDQTFQALTHRNYDFVIVGGCRAQLHFDSKLISGRTGFSVFNAGLKVDSLGNADFTAHLAFPVTKQLVIVVDDGDWETTIDDLRPEVQRRRIWFDHLSPQDRLDIAYRYHLFGASFPSHLYRYFGEGRELWSAFSQLQKNAPVAASDRYDPRAAEQNIIPTLNDPRVSVEGVRRVFNPTPFARELVEKIIVDSKRAGVEPILVVVPMHRYRATDEVNAMQNALASSIATKHQVKFLTYLDNKNAFALTDVWWSDQGHMNRLGAEAFSQAFADDLNRLYRERK